jgi:hypothetical protein
LSALDVAYWQSRNFILHGILFAGMFSLEHYVSQHVFRRT